MTAMPAETELRVVDIDQSAAELTPPPPAADAPADAPATEAGDDPDAPYGRRADGTPKAKPGRRPKNGSAPRPSARPPKRTASSPRASTPKKPAGPDYAGAIMGILQLPMAGLALAGTKDPRFLADAATLELYAPPAAQALADVAREQPAVAAALDRLMQVGPYGAIVGVLVPMGLQIMANHNMIKPGTMGTMDAETLQATAAAVAGRAA